MQPSQPSAARPLSELSPTLEPTQGLPDRIYAALKHRILTCTLLPEQRLLEKDLSTNLGVSRTPIREALNRLALERLVVLTPFRGYAVAPVLLSDIRNLSELRRIVESESAALAALRANAEDLERLHSIAALHYSPGNRATYEQYLRDNSAFHEALAQCARNERLQAVIATVLDQIQRPLYLGLDEGLDPESATAEHLEVIDAIAAHNPDAARRSMADQISRAEERIFAAVRAMKSGQSEPATRTGRP